MQAKAKKKYGDNIELVDISIGDNQASITVPLYVVGGSCLMGGAVLCASATEEKEVYKNGETKTENEITNHSVYGVGMGMAFSSLFAYMFKGVKATATVVEAVSTPEYFFVSEDDIKKKAHQAEVEVKKKLEKEKFLEKLSKLKNDLDECEKELGIIKQEDEALKDKIYKRVAKANSPVAIISQGIDRINSAGGVSCYINFANVSGKTAKYVNFTVVPYNRVYDKTYSEVGGESEKIINVTNFIPNNAEYSGKWENVWYNNTIQSMKIEKIEMIFTDDTKMIISTSEKIKDAYFTDGELAEVKVLNNKMKELESKLFVVGNEINRLER